MGFPLPAPSVLGLRCIISLLLLQVSPSRGYLSEEFAGKESSESTYCLQEETADCEKGTMAEAQDTDVQMDSPEVMDDNDQGGTHQKHDEEGMEHEEKNNDQKKETNKEGEMEDVKEEGGAVKRKEREDRDNDGEGGAQDLKKAKQIEMGEGEGMVERKGEEAGEGGGMGAVKRKEREDRDNDGEGGAQDLKKAKQIEMGEGEGMVERKGEEAGEGGGIGDKEGEGTGVGGGKGPGKGEEGGELGGKDGEGKKEGDGDGEKEEEEEPLPQFPDTLEGFGYSFNDEGQLRQLESGEPFAFVVKEGDKRYNQAHYEALGEVITEHVYHLLETEAALQKVVVPLDAKDEEPESFVFQSPDALSSKKLMVIIHGSGVVRAGQWARRLIMNDCLDSGTQLPFIKRAREEGYGMLVLNTNRNHVTVGGKETEIRENSSPMKHASYVWKHIVEEAKAKEIYIVAHSYGGIVTVHVADEARFRADFQKRVKKIAFTDSVHNFGQQGTSSSVKRWMASHAVNWVSCADPLDKKQKTERGGVPRFSAGTTKHEETSYFSMKSIFKYFKARWQ